VWRESHHVKIRDIQTIPVFNGHRNILHVLVHTDEGISGIGESGMSNRELAVQGAVEHFKAQLIGQDPFRIEYLWQVMSRGNFFPANGIQASALSAIDCALWDIKGKALGVPVYQLLGGLARDKVLCYCHLGDTNDRPRMIERAKKMTADGWKALRFGSVICGDCFSVRQCLRESIDYFAAVREAVGPQVELILDAHTRFDLPEAIKLGRELEPYDPYFLEDPLRAENFDQYGELRRHVHVPIGAGEHCGNKFEFRRLIENDWIDYCRVDPCLVGGLTEAKKIAGMCEAHHIRLAVHNPLGPVSTAICVHLNLACPNVGAMEQPGLPGLLPAVFTKQMEWKDGYMLPPTAPGLGIEFNVEEALKHPFRLHEPPQTRALDGSVTNW
jgi:L-alanine-DL-glutamate epimerase-like enolase superfamily enzyme